MTESGSTSYRKKAMPAEPVEELDIDDIDDIDEVDEVPRIYTRTGKAAPTEVLPASKKPAEQVEEVELQQPEPEPEPVAEPVDVAVERVDEPAAAQPLVPAKETPLDRGTIDFGLLLLRLVLGAVLILSAVATFFQLGNNEGLAGLEEQLADYHYPHVLSIVLPTLQLAAGVFLVLGLITPVAAMVAVAATGFEAIHLITAAENGANAFTWEPSVWLAIALLGMALSVQFTGPGIFGVDFSRSWARRPVVTSWICAALGIAAAVLMWWFL